MKVNGRRELIIPPDLAYGQQGQPPSIGPNETLVFVIDLLRVQPGPAGGENVPPQ
jgi:peptidylprolyl isomerase